MDPGAGITRVLAPNPGPLTLEGTNTYLVGKVVIDPGPLDETHLSAVVDAAEAGGVDAIVLTHGHLDHSDGAGRLRELLGGPPIHAVDERLCVDAAPLTEGARVGDLVVHLVPGHTADSAAFRLPDRAVLFSGDTVLGRGPSFVAHPDGALAPYLASLRRLREMAASGQIVGILPGHGPAVDDPPGVLDYYLAHRAERLEQVRAAVNAGARTADEVVERVYADVDRSLWPAATRSVEAQLAYLRDEPSLRQ